MLGSVFLASVLFDSPVASTFTTDGVQRRPLLRRHFIAWDRVGQLTRTRPVIAGALKGLTPGGMAAKVGRRRYLLVDQCEALREFQELVELLDDRYVTLGIDEMVQPPEIDRSDVDVSAETLAARWVNHAPAKAPTGR